MSRWPLYEPPTALVFTADEAKALGECAGKYPDLFKKLQVHNNQYAAIVNTHNKKALAINLKQLDALGHEKAEMEELKVMWMKKYSIKE